MRPEGIQGVTTQDAAPDNCGAYRGRGGRGDGGGKEKLPERLVEVNSEEWEYR